MPNIEMPEQHRSALLTPQAFEQIMVGEHRYRVLEPVGHGYLGVVWKVSDDHGRIRAAKISTYDDFEEKSYRAEISFAAQLEQYGLFTRIHDGGAVSLTIGGTDVRSSALSKIG